MKRAVGTPFRSEYGFSGPGFVVDELGNISAKSITTVDEITTGGTTTSTVRDYKFQDDPAHFFLDSDPTTFNPTITFERGRRYLVELALTSLEFYLLEDDLITALSSYISHSDGTSGIAAQGKQTGILSITLPSTYDQDVIYYSNSSKTIYGVINVIDPIGVFSSVTINGVNAATSSSTGSLIVDGGVGIKGDLYIDGKLNFDGTGFTELVSSTNLIIGAGNKISIKMGNQTIGSINDTGLSIPINNSNITESVINNTVIGDVVPSSAAFTSASVTQTPSNSTDVTNKSYVDTQATAFAIVFGL